MNTEKNKEELMRELRENGKVEKIGGIIIFFCGLILTFVIMIGVGKIQGIIIGIPVILLGVILTQMGKTCSDLDKSWMLKRHPEMLELVEDLDKNPIFEDETIIVSNRAIASKDHVISVLDRNEVVSILDLSKYLRENSSPSQWARSPYNYMYKYSFELRTANRKIYILGTSKNTNVELIKKYCPNATIVTKR